MLYKANGHKFRTGCQKDSSKKRAYSIQQIVIKLCDPSNMKTVFFFPFNNKKQLLNCTGKP